MYQLLRKTISLINLIFFVCYFINPLLGESVSNSNTVLPKDEKTTKEKILYLNQQALNNLDSQPELAFYYAEQAINVGSDLDDKELLAKSFSILGKCYKETGKTDSAVVYLQKSIDYFKQIGDSVSAGYTMNDLALVYKIRAEFRKGIELLDEVLQFYPQLNVQLLKGLTFENIGKLHYSLGEYDKSSEYEFRALLIAEQEKDTNAMARACNNIGNVYGALNEDDQSIKYYTKAMVLNKASGNNELLSCNLNNIGNSYCGRGVYDSALFYFQKAIDVLGDANNKIWLAIYYNNVGDVFSKMHNYNESIRNFEKARQLFEFTGDVKGISLIYREMSEMYLEKGDFNATIINAQKALSIAKDIEAKDYLMPTYELLAKANAGLKNYKEAYNHQLNFKRMSDSVLSEKSQKQLQELGYKYETKKKEKELQIQKIQIEHQKSDLKRKRVLIVFILIGFVVTAGFLISVTINYYHQKRDHEALFRQNLEVVEFEQKQAQSNDGDSFAKKGLKDHDKEPMIAAFERLMNHQRMYRNPGLTLQVVAEELGTNRVYFSQLINEVYNKHFNNLINEFRIKEARHVLLNTEYDDFSMEGIAQLVGFNSKSVFNEAFKKITGLTPSNYKNLARQSAFQKHEA